MRESGIFVKESGEDRGRWYLWYSCWGGRPYVCKMGSRRLVTALEHSLMNPSVSSETRIKAIRCATTFDQVGDGDEGSSPNSMDLPLISAGKTVGALGEASMSIIFTFSPASFGNITGGTMVA